MESANQAVGHCDISSVAPRLCKRQTRTDSPPGHTAEKTAQTFLGPTRKSMKKPENETTLLLVNNRYLHDLMFLFNLTLAALSISCNLCSMTNEHLNVYPPFISTFTGTLEETGQDKVQHQ